MRVLHLAAVLLVLPAGRARGAFDELGVGARAPGMADAFTAVADDVSAIHYNPAGLATLGRPQLGTSYSRLYPGLEDGSELSDSFLGYSHPIGDDAALATAWKTLTLNGGLYREQTIYLSHARRLPAGPLSGALYGGATVKYLDSTIGSVPERSNALVGGSLQRSGNADPALAKGVSAFDSDLGFLYKLDKHYSFGVQARHVNRPNVAVAGTDRLPLGLRVGADYRSLISNLVFEYGTSQAPAGGQDHTATLAAEHWFPRLMVGEFGLRGGLGFGSRQYRVLAAGVSFRTPRMEISYSMDLPVGSISSSFGAHRVGLTFRFGRRTEEEESLQMVLEMMRQLKLEAGASPRAGLSRLSASHRAIADEHLGHAKLHAEAARYEEARRAVDRALSVAPADEGLLDQHRRLSLVCRTIPALPDFNSNPVSSALHQSILLYVGAREVSAIEKASYALSLSPRDERVNKLLTELELATGLKRRELEAGGPRAYELASLLTRAAAAVQESRWNEAVELSQAALKLDADSAAAWENLGTARLALGDRAGSRAAWEKAYELEKNPSIRVAIKGYLKTLARAESRGPAAKPAAAPAPRRVMPPEERERLFSEGIGHYTSRRFAEAARSFEQILGADPDDVGARNALNRVKDEMR